MAQPGLKLSRILLVAPDPWDSGVIEEALAEIDERQYWNTASRSLRAVPSESLSEALQYLAEVRFDLILLDLFLEDSHALHTLVRVRQAAPDTAIIVLATTEHEELALRATREGAQDYLIKSEIDREPLARAMRYAIERKQLELAIERLSIRDPATDLYNRSGFMELARREMKLARRAGFDVRLLTADIVEASDLSLALMEAADLLRAVFCSDDLVARVGPSRLAVLLTDRRDGSVDEVHLRRRIEEHNAEPRQSMPFGLEITTVRIDSEDAIEDAIDPSGAVCENGAVIARLAP